MAKGEVKVFAVMDAKDGKLLKLVEAVSVKQVKDHLIGNVEIAPASALTVARADMEVEKA